MSLSLSWLSLATVLSAGAPDPAPPGSKGGEDDPGLAAVLLPILKKHGLPALGACVVREGKPVAVEAVGVRRRGTDVPVKPGDRFHLGSCTKAMTATLLGALVEEGKLSFGSTVGEVFPELEASLHPSWKGVTLEMLLGHRGGAPPGFADELWARLRKPRGTPSRERSFLLREVLAKEPDSPPGKLFAYSNTGYIIAGAMAERVTRKSWEDLMRERLFKPLGMASAGFGPPGRKGTLDQPCGHTEKGEPLEPSPEADNPPMLGPAGTVHASLEDWGRFVALHLEAAAGRADLKGARLLKPETFARLHRPLPGKDARYSLGWVHAERAWGGGEVLLHDGSNTFWFCVVWMAPKKDFAVLVAANQGGKAAEKACDDAAAALIRKYLESRSGRP